MFEWFRIRRCFICCIIARWGKGWAGAWAAAKEQWEEGAVSTSAGLGPAGCRFVLGISAFHVDSLGLRGQGLSHSHPGNCDGNPQPSNVRHWGCIPEQFILGEGSLEGLQVGLGRADEERGVRKERRNISSLSLLRCCHSAKRVPISQQNLPMLKDEISKEF